MSERAELIKWLFEKCPDHGCIDYYGKRRKSFRNRINCNTCKEKLRNEAMELRKDGH